LTHNRPHVLSLCAEVELAGEKLGRDNQPTLQVQDTLATTHLSQCISHTGCQGLPRISKCFSNASPNDRVLDLPSLQPGFLTEHETQSKTLEGQEMLSLHRSEQSAHAQFLQEQVVKCWKAPIITVSTCTGLGKWILRASCAQFCEPVSITPMVTEMTSTLLR
jgi:hypothetical protein